MKTIKYFSVREIALDHLREIQLIQPSGPYYLGGFSFGGILALEVSHLLKEQGETVNLLALFDPTLPKIKKRYSLTNIHNNTIETGTLKSSLLNIVPAIKHKGKKIFNKTIPAKLRRLKYKACILTNRTVPAKVRIDELLDVFDIASNKHQAKIHNGDIDLFIPDTIAKDSSKDQDSLMQWNAFATGKIRVHVVEDAVTHLEIIEEPGVKCLSKKLNERLMITQKTSL